MATKIPWADKVWNPLTGCTKASIGCRNCYAEKLSYRWKAAGQKKYENGFDLTLHPDFIDQPLRWRKPKMIFVNSMSDLFHEDVPVDFIKRVFETMNNAPQHIFQVLTKRSERLKKIAPQLNWTENIWAGVSVENDEVKYRIDDLLQTEAAIKFISFEPLISAVNVTTLKGIDWTIIGGESGASWRNMDIKWVDHIHSVCTKENIPFFFKQWAGFSKKKVGRIYRDQEWNEYPL